MRTFIKFLFLFCAVSSELTVQASTEKLDLNSAINVAISKSPRIKQTVARKSELDWAETESFSGFLPNVSVSANHFFDNTFQVLQFPPIGTFSLLYPYSTFNLDASLTVFDGFQTYNRFRAAKLAYKASELEDSYTRLQVEEEVSLKFYQALAAQDLAAVADQNLKTLEDHLSKVQTQIRVGTATKFDILRIEVQLNDARSEKLNAEDSFALARMSLAQTLGQSSDLGTLVGELPLPNPDKLKNLKGPEDVKRADIIAKDLQVEAAERRQSESNGFWYPKLSVIGEYQLYNNVDHTLDNSTTAYKNTYFIGASLSWNLFDGGASVARSQEAIYKERQVEALAEIAKLQMPYDLSLWKRRYLYNTQVYLAKKSDVIKAEESVRLATLGLRAGTRTSSEVLDAELDLFRARAGAVKAQADAAEAQINLELAIGQRI